MPLEIFAEERHIREIQRIGDVVDGKVGRFQLCLCIHDHHRGDDLDTSLVGRLLDNRTEMRRSYAEFLGMKVSEKAAFFFCYAARLLSIFIFKISLVFSIITFREVILQK